jgi:hypothetical protein
MKESLREISERVNTNKLYHQYEYFYEDKLKHLRNRKIKLLEIGIFEGNSLRMWKEYFPKAEIYGIDVVDDLLFTEERIHTFKADQGKRHQLKQLMDELGKFDVIIDDGSHRVDHQQISMGVCFPYLKNGGHYIMEDLHTSYFYSIHRHQWLDLFDKYNISRDFSNTTYLMLQNFNIFGKVHSQYMTEEELEYINKTIDTVDINIENNMASCTADIVKKRRTKK